MTEIADVGYILLKPEDREVISRFTEAVEALRVEGPRFSDPPTKGQVRIMRGVLQRKPFGRTDQENEVMLVAEVLHNLFNRQYGPPSYDWGELEERERDQFCQIAEEFLRWHAIYRAAVNKVCEHPYTQVEAGVCQRCGASLTITFPPSERG